MLRSGCRQARTASAGAAVVIGALLLSACSSSGSGGGAGTSSADGTTGPSTGTTNGVVEVAAAAKLLPAALKTKGELRVASDATYPPLEFIAANGSTVIGADADLATAIGKVLGIKTVMVNTSFDSIIPSLQAGKFDMGMSGFNDTKERQAAVDFVDYYRGGSSFFVKAQGGASVATLADLCGKKVSVEKGTTQQDDATAQSAKCKSAGKPAVTVLAYPDQNSTNLALISGRAQVSIADSPVAAYAVKRSDGQLKLSGKEYGSVLHGIAVPKGSGLAPAVQAAVTALIKQGAYGTIMKKWGISDADTLTAASINGG